MRPCLLLFLAACLWADADFGVRTKHSARITVSRPPDAMLRGKNITIRSRGESAFKDRQSLESAVERALAGEYTPSKDGKDLVVTLVVSSFQSVTGGNKTVTENRNVVVGKKTIKNIITGKPQVVDDYQFRDVPVVYWEGRGALGVQVTVHDASGTLVDTWNPQGSYSNRVELSVNRVSKPGAAPPTPAEIQSGMINQIAAEIQKRYTKTVENVEVRLTVDEPLRPGNVFAMSGQWKEALAQWKSAPLKKNPGDRAYNMAVAYEALAYAAYDASRNPDDAEEPFKQALVLYDEALRSDPGEKFFRQAQERAAAMKANFGRAKEHYATQQRQAEVELAKAEAKRQQEEENRLVLESNRADTQDEADFRVIVRGRLRNVPGEPDDATRAKLVQLGKDAYKLDDLLSTRVVSQEVRRRAKVGANLELYKQTFADLVADKALDATDRGALTRLAQRLELTSDEVRPVEGQFEFQDRTAPPPPPPPPPVATPKPKTAAPKPAPPKPAATKPQPVPAPKTVTPTGIKK